MILDEDINCKLQQLGSKEQFEIGQELYKQFTDIHYCYYRFAF